MKVTALETYFLVLAAAAGAALASALCHRFLEPRRLVQTGE
jgi:hypothetical protein